MTRFTAEERVRIYEDAVEHISYYHAIDHELCLLLVDYLRDKIDDVVGVDIELWFPELIRFKTENGRGFYSYYNNIDKHKIYFFHDRNLHRISVLKAMIEDARKEAGKCN